MQNETQQQDYQRYGMAIQGEVHSRTVAMYHQALAWKPYFEEIFSETFDTPERVAEMERRALEIQQAYMNEHGIIGIANFGAVGHGAALARIFGRNAKQVAYGPYAGQTRFEAI